MTMLENEDAGEPSLSELVTQLAASPQIDLEAQLRTMRFGTGALLISIMMVSGAGAFVSIWLYQSWLAWFGFLAVWLLVWFALVMLRRWYGFVRAALDHERLSFAVATKAVMMGQLAEAHVLEPDELKSEDGGVSPFGGIWTLPFDEIKNFGAPPPHPDAE